MSRLSALPRAGSVALTALVLAALGSAASLILLDRQVEHQFSELQAYAAGDTVDRLALLERDQGPEALVQVVQRATETASPGQLFLVTDGQGRKLAGNLAGWPQELRPDDDWTAFRLADGTTGRAITADLDGQRVLIGQSDATRRPVRRAIVLSAAAAFGFLAAALIGVATIWARLVGARLDRLAQAARAIAGGDRKTRLPLGRGDAFDDLAGALNQMVDENLRLVSGLEAVTHSLAHDMRTPLMRMRAAIADARAVETRSEQDAALERAEQQADLAVSTFTGLADLALAESGLSREAMQTITLDELVRDVADLFEPLAEERGQTLAAAVEPLALPGHRQLLFQALANLTANAIRYAPENTSIEIALTKADGGAAMTVRDFGRGLTAVEAAEALRPFVRLDAAGPGLGLGLAIVGAVARLHEGELRLEPADPGLRATLRLWTAPSAQDLERREKRRY